MDRLPVTHENSAFPIGDVDVGHKSEMIDQWLEDISSYSEHRLVNYLNFTAEPDDSEIAAVFANHDTALMLCRHWDTGRNGETSFALSGFMMARAMLNKVNMLPTFDRALTQDLNEMRKTPPEQIRMIGKSAWSGMQHSHPSLFEQYAKLLDMSSKSFDLGAPEDKEYFITGMMLPYIMSVTTQLEHSYERMRVTGVRKGTVKELEAMEFSQIFVSEK